LLFVQRQAVKPRRVAETVDRG